MLPLTFLNPGETAIVSEILGDSALVHRLRELGLRSGAAVEMVQRGNPCIIRLAGNKLCLRGDDVSTVLVQLGVST